MYYAHDYKTYTAMQISEASVEKLRSNLARVAHTHQSDMTFETLAGSLKKIGINTVYDEAEAGATEQPGKQFVGPSLASLFCHEPVPDRPPWGGPLLLYSIPEKREGVKHFAPSQRSSVERYDGSKKSEILQRTQSGISRAFPWTRSS